MIRLYCKKIKRGRTTTTTIISGDIEFSFTEGENASLTNAFPVSDQVGAQDTPGEYIFDVKTKSSSTNAKMNYNVWLVDANDDTNTNYFNDEQIKFALIKKGTYVADTSSTLREPQLEKDWYYKIKK